MKTSPIRASRLVVTEDGHTLPRHKDQVFYNVATRNQYPAGIQLEPGIDRYRASFLLRQQGICLATFW